MALRFARSKLDTPYEAHVPTQAGVQRLVSRADEAAFAGLACASPAALRAALVTELKDSQEPSTLLQGRVRARAAQPRNGRVR
jgi:hypothetical protein